MRPPSRRRSPRRDRGATSGRAGGARSALRAPRPGRCRTRLAAGGGLWAEGPVYVPSEDALIWSDVRRNVVHRWSAADGVTDLYRPSDFANGHTLDHDGRVLACEHGPRRVARYEPDGSRTTIVDRYQGRAAQLAERHHRRLGWSDLVHRPAVRDPRRPGGLQGRLRARWLLRVPAGPRRPAS